MSDFNTYNGAVFFVDLLGIGSLTQNELTLNKEDYIAWNLAPMQHNCQYLAGKILFEFRNLLLELKKQYVGVKIAQLSDCAFIWCEDLIIILRFINSFMSRAIYDRGILCRGGVAFGEIIEPINCNIELGSFIVGEAVTKAVMMEGKAKGTRILMDISVPTNIWKYQKFAKEYSLFLSDMLYPIQNPLDYSVVDEFRWYLIDEENFHTRNGVFTFEKIVEITKKRLLLSNILMYSPRFGWNTKSTKGLMQLNAGVASISEDKLLGIKHFYQQSFVLQENRSNTTCKRIEEKILSDEQFFKYDKSTDLDNYIPE